MGMTVRTALDELYPELHRLLNDYEKIADGSIRKAKIKRIRKLIIFLESNL